MFGKLHIGSCAVSVESSNDVKPKVSIVGDSLKIEPFCKCGASQGVFTISDKSSLIIERAREALRAADEKGRRRLIERDESSLINCACSKCGRQWAVSVRFSLAKQWLKRFDHKYTHGHAELLYGECLKVDVEIDGGYFEGERRQPLALADLISPKHACSVPLVVPELRQATEKMIKAISDYWEGGELPKPRKLKIEAKCRYCLGKATIKATLTPELGIIRPNQKLLGQLIKQYKAWQNRVFKP